MPKSIRHAILLAGAAALVAPPAAMAQVRDLDAEQSNVRVYRGQVDGAPASFSLTIPADTALQIDVIASGDFDPVVRVLDAGGNVIAEDDDGGENVNSRVRLGAQDRSRRITIEVDSFDAEWAEGEYGGSFDLRLETNAHAAVGTRPVTYGARETGTLMGDEHLFTMQGRAGEQVEIALVATDDQLDPYLELRDASGEVLAADDDGGADVNALLRFTFPADGTYTIAARGFGESMGGYRLRVREPREVMAQLPLQVIGINDEATGELASDQGGENATMIPTYIDYQLSEEAKAAIRAGQGAVSIRMIASPADDPDFGGTIDPFIELGFDTPLGFALVASDDDSGGELNALLSIDLGPLAAEPALLDMLRIRAKGYGGSAGAYRLVISEGMDTIMPADVPIMLED